ncbi:glycosyltransferase family 39 protein [Actinomadura barringtoniae]|uniref:Glycosyltransferase family 39 protein n=1 Tax=Actinomadura barringtoniae TaxID=1427535 RepID=A0A939TFR5_9ACTN|nr:glycosyltransferase family 39 protein [Actinomadura barringtoniae]MBO2454660.1 glycosyltransferase family 39 protein [Actinomadura barringtoniae]
MTTQQISPPEAEGRAGSAERGRLARLFLGRPEEPRWVRPALWAILVAAGVLYGWGMSASGYANSYYSAAVKSGSQSWSSFFFGSLDTGNFITVDKPPMSLWAQELFARVFGFGSFSLLFPEVLMGVAAVALLYTTVRRAFGYPAALIAAGVLTLTPITVAINRDNNPDTLLVLLLVAAAWAAQKAIESGRLRWLLASAFFVGCGFNTKMLQAFLVVPALALAYLIAARAGVVRRIVHLLAAGAVMAVSSFWWMVVVDLIPASSRPFIGGSTDGTVWDLVIGYNGLGRIFGENNGPGGGRGGPGGGGGFGGTSGAGRMFNDILGGQISWLLPFAAIALVAGLVLLWKRPRVDLARAGLLIWGGWLAVHFVVFSFAEGTFHPYYSTAMGPAIAALTGAGAVLLYGAYRRSAVWAVVLPAAVAITGVWAFMLLNRTPDWNPWLRWVVVAATVLAVAALVAGRLVRGGGRAVTVAGLALAVLAGLAGPGAYAASAASSTTNGTNPLAGPSTGMGFGGPGGMPGGGSRRGGFPGGFPGGGAPPGGMPQGMERGQMPGGGQGEMPKGQTPGGQSQGGQRSGGMGGGPGGEASQAMISYLEKHRNGAQWLLAVSSAQQASSIIISTGQPVIAMGGFTGSDPAMTVAKLQQYVKEGKLHYVMVSGQGGGFGPDRGNSEVSEWVRKNGTLVQPSEYGGSSSSSSSSGSGAQLYYLR